MIEGRGAASHDCADVIALEREAEDCSWLRLGRMASSVTLSASQGVDWAPSGHLSAFQGLPKRDTRSIAGEMPLGSCGLRCVYTLAPTPRNVDRYSARSKSTPRNADSLISASSTGRGRGVQTAFCPEGRHRYGKAPSSRASGRSDEGA